MLHRDRSVIHVFECGWEGQFYDGADVNKPTSSVNICPKQTQLLHFSAILYTSLIYSSVLVYPFISIKEILRADCLKLVMVLHPHINVFVTAEPNTLFLFYHSLKHTNNGACGGPVWVETQLACTYVAVLYHCVCAPACLLAGRLGN